MFFEEDIQNKQNKVSFTEVPLKLEPSQNLFLPSTKEVETIIFSFLTVNDLFKVRLLSKTHFKYIESIYTSNIKTKVPNRSTFSSAYLLKKEQEKVEKQFKLEFNSTCHPPMFRRNKEPETYRYAVDTSKFQPLFGFTKHPESTEEMVLKFSTDLSAEDLIDFEKKCASMKITNNSILQSILRYFNFLTLKSMYPDSLLIATDDIEMIWVSHLLKPKKYIDDCKKLFGMVFDHKFVLQEDEVAIRHESLIETMRLYEQHFKAPYFDKNDIPKKLKEYFEMGRRMTEDIRNRRTYQVLSVRDFQDKTENWKNPFSFSVDDVLVDRKWLKKVELYLRIPSHTYFKSYERYLYLIAKNPEKASQYYPSYQIDLIWHAHMMSPLAYEKDCLNNLGGFLDHDADPNPTKETEKDWYLEYGSNRMDQDHTLKFKNDPNSK